MTDRITADEAARIQAYLRRTLGSQVLAVSLPKRGAGAAEVSVNGEVLAIVHKDTEDGEMSFALSMCILAQDLPPGGSFA